MQFVVSMQAPRYTEKWLCSQTHEYISIRYRYKEIHKDKICIICMIEHCIVAVQPPRLTWHVSWGRRLRSLISLPVHAPPENTLHCTTTSAFSTLGSIVHSVVHAIHTVHARACTLQWIHLAECTSGPGRTLSAVQRWHNSACGEW